MISKCLVVHHFGTALEDGSIGCNKDSLQEFAKWKIDE